MFTICWRFQRGRLIIRRSACTVYSGLRCGRSCAIKISNRFARRGINRYPSNMICILSSSRLHDCWIMYRLTSKSRRCPNLQMRRCTNSDNQYLTIQYTFNASFHEWILNLENKMGQQSRRNASRRKIFRRRSY